MKYSAFFLPIVFLANTALTQEKTLSYNEQLKLSNVTVTATRMAEVDNESASITVFTRDDIERLRPSNVLNLLSHAPGIQVPSYGGRGAAHGLFIRGTNSNQTLVLIDGVRFGSATLGGSTLQYLSVDQIERVEVLRGSNSAIYGSEAIGGVIQIFTRRSTETGLNANVRIAAGSLNTWENSIGVNGGNNNTRFNLTSAYETTDGFNRTQIDNWPNNDDDGYKNKSLSINISHTLNNKHEIGFSLLNQSGESEADNTFSQGKPIDTFDIITNSLYINSQLNHIWVSRLELGYIEDNQQNNDFLNPKNNSKATTYRNSLQWFNTLTINQDNSLLLGLDYIKDKINTTNESSVKERWNNAAIAQYRFNATWIFSEVGTRYDHNEQFGKANTLNGLIGINISNNQTLSIHYAEGFRAPTFNDLYYPYSGNSDLKPETSESYEFKWTGKFSKAEFSASIYRTNITNMIAWAPAPIQGNPDRWIPSNVESVRIDGFEASLFQNIADYETKIGISLIDPKNIITNKQAPNRAKETAFIDIDKQYSKFSAGMSIKTSGASYANATNTQKLSGYTTVDLRANWQISNSLAIDLKLANLFDKDYHRFSYSGGLYEEAPFTAMLGVTWTPSLK